MPRAPRERTGGASAECRFRLRPAGLLFAAAAAIWSLSAAGGEGGGGLPQGASAMVPTRGNVNIDVTERPLKDVLQYLERVSGWNLVPVDDKINDLLVSVHLSNIFWRDALDVIATKEKLILREEAKARVVYIEQPPTVEMTFRDTDIKEVIDAIAKVGNASVVVGPGVKGTVTMSLKGVPWKEALEIVLKTLGYVLVEEKHGVLRVATPQELQQQMETRVFRLSYLMPEGADYVAQISTPYAKRREAKGKSADVVASLRSVLEKVKSASGTIAFEKRTNSVIITDTPAKLNAMAEIIRELDVPPKQVHLSLKFIEMSESDAEELGIDWGTNGITATATGMAFDTMFPFNMGPSNNVLQGTPPGGIGVTTAPSGYVVRLDQTVPNATAGGTSLGRLDMTALTAVLKLIRTHTNARVIQAPEITVLDNEEATIQVGDLVRYAEAEVTTTETGASATGWKEASRSPVELGMQALVIPHVTGPENNVLLTVIPKIESQTGAQLFEEFTSTLGTLKLPQTSRRVVVTKMLLRNRETGVIAGLRHEVRGETVRKIPILGDIPILGWLFRSRSRPAETNRTNNIIIMITPTVIDFQEKEDLKNALGPAQKQLRDIFTVYGEE